MAATKTKKTTAKASVKTQKSSDIPEFIEGIPTKKSLIKERRELIVKYYDSLWKRLQRETGSNYIVNDFLQTKIYIVKNESDKKVVSLAPRKWQSTYAVKHLYQVVKNARTLNGIIEYDKPKTGTQTKNGYKQMMILYHKFISDKYDYLNFTVKLTLGINADKKHIQYSVNRVEIQ